MALSVHEVLKGHKGARLAAVRAAEERVWVIWAKHKDGWYCSERMTKAQADAMCRKLDDQGTEYILSEKRPPSIEDLVEG